MARENEAEKDRAAACLVVEVQRLDLHFVAEIGQPESARGGVVLQQVVLGAADDL